MRTVPPRVVILAILMGGPALAQPPEPEANIAPLAPICLTNACGGAVVDFTGQTRARTVAEAIALGNAQAVKDLGGTAAQAAEALARRAAARLDAEADPALRAQRAVSAEHFAAFADVSAGDPLIFDTGSLPDFTPPAPGARFTGVVVRRPPEGGQAYLMSDGGAVFIPYGRPVGDTPEPVTR